MGRVARIRHDARRSTGAQGVQDVEAAIRHLQYAIARHLRLWYIVAMFPLLLSSEQQPLQADHERQERSAAWPSGTPSGRDI